MVSKVRLGHLGALERDLERVEATAVSPLGSGAWIAPQILTLRSWQGQSVGNMVIQLLAMAEQRWRRINAAHPIPLVRAGVLFSDGIQAKGRSAA